MDLETVIQRKVSQKENRDNTFEEFAIKKSAQSLQYLEQDFLKMSYNRLGHVFMLTGKI